MRVALAHKSENELTNAVWFKHCLSIKLNHIILPLMQAMVKILFDHLKGFAETDTDTETDQGSKGEMDIGCCLFIIRIGVMKQWRNLVLNSVFSFLFSLILYASFNDNFTVNILF